MKGKTLTPEQLGKLSEIDSPILRQRFGLYYQLPQDLQELVFAEESVEKIRSIVVDKNRLRDEDRRYVAWIVGLVLLGEMPIKNLVGELVNSLEISNAQASALAQDINQVIFQPVRESLMEVQGLTPSNKQSPNSTQDKQIINSRKIAQPEPVSMEELEERNKPLTPPKIAMTSPGLEKETNQRRASLLEKLKQDRVEKRVVNLSNKPILKEEGIKQKTQEEPKAVTTAWNGKSIDLTKIPPRRKSTREKDKRIKIHEA